MFFTHFMTICSIALVTFAAFVFDNTVTVTTPVGKIRGIRVTVFSKTTKEFYGIPYAESPTLDRRFCKPIPKVPFNTTFDATVKSTARACPGHPNSITNVDEDCLRLNIYAPDAASPQRKVPVMIWIHGGGFISGTSIIYNATLISGYGNVIVVTVNYRLAELGFLSTATGSLKGNYGLWDQHLAIKWVYNNIASFGGNSDQVTIFGESAGSSSVVYQTLYPGNRGLFHRAIAESGSITSPWAYKNKQTSSDNAHIFAQGCGCNQPSDDAMVDCLRVLPSSVMSSCVTSIEKGYLDYNFAWTAVVDGEFIPTNQWEMFSDSPATKQALDFFRSIDLMIGVNKADGELYLKDWNIRIGHDLVTNPSVTKEQFRDRIVPEFSRFGGPFNDTSARFKQNILSFYGSDDTHEMLRNLVQFTTDIMFIAPTQLALGAHVKGNSTRAFMYEFAQSPPTHHLPVIPSLEDGTMANHADELTYVFGLIQLHGKPVDIKISNTMIKMWTNFAKTGDPNHPISFQSDYHVTWDAYTGSKHNYLEITSNMTQASVKQDLSGPAVQMLLNRK